MHDRRTKERGEGRGGEGRQGEKGNNIKSSFTNYSKRLVVALVCFDAAAGISADDTN